MENTYKIKADRPYLLAMERIKVWSSILHSWEPFRGSDSYDVDYILDLEHRISLLRRKWL